MKILKQMDSRWSTLPIGKTSSSIGNYGCAITGLSMLSDWYGKYRDPAWMAKNLTFTGDGSIIWNSITKSELPMKFVYRYYQRDDNKLKDILFSKDGSCLLQVPLVIKGKTYKHWVALVGFSKLGGFRIADPFYGDITYLKNRYSKILGFTELTRK